MKEIRLTFPSEGFAAVSQVLVDMGLSFRVEPAGTAAKQEAAPEATASVAGPRAPARTARKTSGKPRKAVRPEKAAQTGEAPSAGAERLRAAIARSGTAYRSLVEPAANPSGPAIPGGEQTGESGSE